MPELVTALDADERVAADIGEDSLEVFIGHPRAIGGFGDDDRVTLEVRASNDPAKLLYVTMGFAPVGIRRRYYRDNDEDAIVMVKRLGERKAT